MLIHQLVMKDYHCPVQTTHVSLISFPLLCICFVYLFFPIFQSTFFLPIFIFYSWKKKFKTCVISTNFLNGFFKFINEILFDLSIIKWIMHNKDIISGSLIFCLPSEYKQVACTCSIYHYGGRDHLMVLDLSKNGLAIL
jgi:hypothetical protein